MTLKYSENMVLVVYCDPKHILRAGVAKFSSHVPSSVLHFCLFVIFLVSVLLFLHLKRFSGLPYAVFFY